MTGKKCVLLITSLQTPALKDVLVRPLYEPPVIASKASQAKQILTRQSFDLIILQTPVADEFGVRTAAEIAARYHQPVLVLVKPEIYDQTCYQLRDSLAFVLSVPAGKNMLIQSLHFIEQTAHQMKTLEERLLKEKQKNLDEKIISRCKLLLIENYRWSEEKAHHYIEKLAMDHSITRAAVSRTLVNKMEQKFNGKSA